jgi:hypothetical protein
MHSVSLTNLYFWRLGREYLVPFFTSYLSPLANKAIICVGDYHTTKYLDYPENLLTDDEKAELEAGLEPGEGECPIEYYSRGPVNLYKLADARYSGFKDYDINSLFMCRSFRGKFDYRNRFIDLARSETLGFPKHERSQALALAAPECEKFYPRDREWVLRNLTTREFIRAFAIDAIIKGDVNGPETLALGFGRVVLSRICWSSEPDTRIDCEGVHRGVWAGHRFDITIADKLEKENEDGQWKDVTVDVLMELWKLLK